MTATSELEVIAQMVRTVVPVWVAAHPSSVTWPICGGAWPGGWRYDATGPKIRVTGPGVAHEWTRRQVLDAVLTVTADPDLVALLDQWRARQPGAGDDYQLRHDIEGPYSQRAATLLTNRSGQLDLFSMAV